MGGQVTTMIERSRGEGRGVRRTTTAVRRTEGDLLLLLIAWTITVTPLDPAVALPPLETADTSTTVTWAKAITGRTDNFLVHPQQSKIRERLRSCPPPLSHIRRDSSHPRSRDSYRTPRFAAPRLRLSQCCLVNSLEQG